MPRYVVEGQYRRHSFDDPEGGRAYIEVDAANAREAKVLAARSPEFADDIRDARADKANPFGRIVAYRYPKHYEEAADYPTCWVEGPADANGDPTGDTCAECNAWWEHIRQRIEALDHKYGY